MTTPNMSLVLPAEGGSTDIWDTILDTAFGLIDSHDHTTGKGVPVPSAGLKINADVAWSFAGTNYAITAVKACDFTPVAASTITAYSSALFSNSSDGDNLYYRNSAGTNVKITSGSTLNISIVGGIGGDYTSVSALLSFDDATDSYWLQQQGSPRPWARVRVGDVDIYQTAASITNRIRLMSPAALAASYALTLPPAAGGSAGGQFLVDTTGTGVLGFANSTAVATTFTGGIALPTQYPIFIPAAAAAADVSGPTFVTGSWALATSTARLTYPFTPDSGGTVKLWTLYLRKTSATGTITARMYKMNNATGVETALGSAQTNAANAPGYVTLGESGTSYAIATNESMYLVVTGGGTTGDFAFGVEIDRTRTA